MRRRDRSIAAPRAPACVEGYFFGAAAPCGTFVLGGVVAVGGGECAPDASSGFDAGGAGA
jgi:hypothetical protein